MVTGHMASLVLMSHAQKQKNIVELTEEFAMSIESARTVTGLSPGPDVSNHIRPNSIVCI